MSRFAAPRVPDPPHHGNLLITTLAEAVAAAVVTGLAAWAVKQLLAPSLTRAGTGLASWLADHSAVLRSSSLRRIRRYQRSLAGYAAEHTLGFGTEPISVRDVYVPLHREAPAGARREDLHEQIRRAGHTVVTGEAGAGKSMLLKHSLQEWSDRRTDRRARIPVLVELRRVNTLDAAEIDLAAHVTEVLKTHRYKGAASFVPKALEDGRLSLLFDGLDEVTADRLDRVVDLLRDFARRYDGCQVVVTCRTSLYRGELDFGTVVRVAELDDATIRRLLSRWPGLDHAAQERLYRALGTNGTLRRLARSPLLLSMMAWLTASRITLPTSRVEFYDTAIEHMVRRDDLLNRRRSQFTPNKKLAVLRGLALLLQDRAGTDADRLSFSHAEALDHIRSMAPVIDLDQKDAEPLLKEIADRTELLVSTGGVAPRYTFRHLTFQEYLAAVELRDDRDGLLARYDRDRNAWREAVILWCGQAGHGAGPLIKELMSRTSADERVLALECAAATTEADEATVTAIVDSLLPSLRATTPEEREQAAVAFGNAAAGSGPRSEVIRGRLLATARDSSRGGAGVLRALALSGHESAADFLAELAVTDATAREALRSMGDLAVPSLAARAGRDDLDAIDDLAAIGTPQAVEALHELLDGTGAGARRSAWRLAGLVGDSAFGAAVARRGAPTAGEAAHGSFGWVWQPFSEDHAVITTVARIVELIEDSADDEAPDDLSPLDFRLVLALTVVIREPSSRLSREEVTRRVNELTGSQASGNPFADALVEAFGALADRPLPTAETTELVGWIFDGFHLDGRKRRMIGSLALPEQIRALRTLVLDETPRQWSRTAFRRAGRAASRAARQLMVSWALCAISNAVSVAVLFGRTAALPTWLAWSGLAGTAVVVVGFSATAVRLIELWQVVILAVAGDRLVGWPLAAMIFAAFFASNRYVTALEDEGTEWVLEAIKESAAATASASIIPGP